MTDEEREKIKVWIEGWKEVDSIQERLRRESVRESGLAESIAAFDDAFRSALWLVPAVPTSGLIEFHRILSKSR